MKKEQESAPEVEVSSAEADTFQRMLEARHAAQKWKHEEQRLRAQLLADMGYDDDDPKPQPVNAVEDGVPVFRIKVSQRKGVDMTYLRKHHPQAVAEAERFTAVKTITEY